METGLKWPRFFDSDIAGIGGLGASMSQALAATHLSPLCSSL